MIGKASLRERAARLPWSPEGHRRQVQRLRAQRDMVQRLRLRPGVTRHGLSKAKRGSRSTPGQRSPL